VPYNNRFEASKKLGRAQFPIILEKEIGVRDQLIIILEHTKRGSRDLIFTNEVE